MSNTLPNFISLSPELKVQYDECKNEYQQHLYGILCREVMHFNELSAKKDDKDQENKIACIKQLGVIEYLYQRWKIYGTLEGTSHKSIFG